MSRKIVIIPEFASSHFLNCWIPNIIETLDPYAIIINSGLFPEGPENKGHIDEAFREKYCWKGTTAGFDLDETVETCKQYAGLIKLNLISYNSNDSVECFKQAISHFGMNEPEPGSIIFVLEPDAFLLELDKNIINEELSKLRPGEGLRCLWRDFLETQFYCENINEFQPKWRRFAYCWDNLENYLEAMGNGFMSQDYPKLKKTDKFWIRHYPWFVFSKWKQLRFDLIHRSNPDYWQDFEKGLQEIRSMTEIYVDYLKPNSDGTINLNKIIPSNKILIRPSRQDEGRWAKFIDVEHPKAIQSHTNFIK